MIVNLYKPCITKKISADCEQSRYRIYRNLTKNLTHRTDQMHRTRSSLSELFERTMKSPDKGEIDGTNSSKVCTIYSTICFL